MKILKISLSEDEQITIYDQLITRFNEEDSVQKIEFTLYDLLPFIIAARYEYVSDLFSVESELELYTEYADFDENHQTEIISRSVLKFRITFFYDSEEVEVKDLNIEDRIKKYYEI